MKVVILFIQMLLLTSISLPLQQSSDKTVRSVAVGDIAPDFTLVDKNNKKVKLSDALCKSQVVILFYRGYW